MCRDNKMLWILFVVCFVLLSVNSFNSNTFHCECSQTGLTCEVAQCPFFLLFTAWNCRWLKEIKKATLFLSSRIVHFIFEEKNRREKTDNGNGNTRALRVHEHYCMFLSDSWVYLKCKSPHQSVFFHPCRRTNILPVCFVFFPWHEVRTLMLILSSSAINS